VPIVQGCAPVSQETNVATFDTRQYAEHVFTSEETHRAMTADGIDLAPLTVGYLEAA